MRKTTIALLGALIPALAAADERTLDRTVQADAAGEVVISNVSGSVEVRGWDRREVQVRGELGRDVERVDIESSGGRTHIKVVLPRGSARHGSAELEVFVPRNSALEVTTVSAEIESDDVLGAQRLKSMSGEITAAVANETDARSVSGEITLRASGATKSVRVSTVSGSIEVDGASGKVDAVTVSGDAHIRMGDAQEVRARTTSGNVHLNARLLANARVDVEAVSGEVILRLTGATADNLAAEIESFSGDIHGCLAKSVERTSKYGPGVRLNLRGGPESSARVRAKTLSGSIDICDR